MMSAEIESGRLMWTSKCVERQGARVNICTYILHLWARTFERTIKAGTFPLIYTRFLQIPRHFALALPKTP